MENTLQPLKIESLIHEIRGHKVMLDRDLAKLYGVETKVLNQAVKRNIKRFPEDFMFQLSNEELFDESTRPNEEQRKELKEKIKNEIVRLLSK